MFGIILMTVTAVRTDEQLQQEVQALKKLNASLIPLLLNDQRSLRKAGAKSDPHSSFEKLVKEAIPYNYCGLKRESKDLQNE